MAKAKKVIKEIKENNNDLVQVRRTDRNDIVRVYSREIANRLVSKGIGVIIKTVEITEKEASVKNEDPVETLSPAAEEEKGSAPDIL